MKRIFTFLLALVMALGMFPIQAIPVQAVEIEEPTQEEIILENTTVTAKTELEATIEKQIRAFAKSINKKDADDDAAWELAQHGMLGRGKKLSVGKNHALTAALMNSELGLTTVIRGCEMGIELMQRLNMTEIFDIGSCDWGSNPLSFFNMIHPEVADENASVLYAAERVNFTGKTNSYDSSLVWIVGGADVRTTITKASVTADTVTYHVTVSFEDRFDFSTSSNSGFKNLISGLGALLFKEFDWIATATFSLTVDNGCSHDSNAYYWRYDAGTQSMASIKTDEFGENQAEKYTIAGSASYYELDRTVTLLHNVPWELEYTVKNPGQILLSPTRRSFNDCFDFQLYYRNHFFIQNTERIGDTYKHHCYGYTLANLFHFAADQTYTIRLENVIAENGSNMIYVSVYNHDLQKTVLKALPMDDYYWMQNGVLALQDDESGRLSGEDLRIQYIGNVNYPFASEIFELKVWENGKNGESDGCFTDKSTKPTCEDRGYTTHTCSLCGYSYKDTYVDAPGHTWDEGVVTKEPTEETAGVLTYTCITCGETKSEELPILEHTHRYEETVTAPTCTEQGYTTYTCTCGDSYVDTYVEALGHDLADWKEIVAPTCTQKGSERRTCANCDYSEEQDLEATGHHYQPTVIAPTFTKQGYTEYVCSNCDDRYVEEESYTDPLGLPKPVVKAAQNKQTGGGILTWEADREADSYKIYRATSSKGKYSLYKTVTEPTATVSVPVGKTYYFKVKAICEEDSTLSSPYSSIVKVTGKCAQPKAKVSNNTSGYPVVSWGKVTGTKKYWVYRATSENGKYTRVTITTKLSYTDTKASTGKTYFYKVKAVASKTTYNSECSEIINCLKKLSKPTITLTTSQTKGTITVKWKKVTGATGYELQRKVNSGEYETVKTGMVLSYTDKNVEPGNKYTYRLKAIGSREELNNGYSSVKSATIKAGKPSVSIKLAKNKPSLSWKEAEGAVKYQVYYATSKYGKYKLLKTTEDLTYTYTSAKKGKTYYFKVRAVDQNGTAGDYSTVKSIKSK